MGRKKKPPAKGTNLRWLDAAIALYALLEQKSIIIHRAQKEVHDALTTTLEHNGVQYKETSERYEWEVSLVL